jgi:hypothetical protein
LLAANQPETPQEPEEQFLAHLRERRALVLYVALDDAPSGPQLGIRLRVQDLRANTEVPGLPPRGELLQLLGKAGGGGIDVDLDDLGGAARAAAVAAAAAAAGYTEEERAGLPPGGCAPLGSMHKVGGMAYVHAGKWTLFYAAARACYPEGTPARRPAAVRVLDLRSRAGDATWEEVGE